MTTASARLTQAGLCWTSLRVASAIVWLGSLATSLTRIDAGLATTLIASIRRVLLVSFELSETSHRLEYNSIKRPPLPGRVCVLSILRHRAGDGAAEGSG